MGGSCTGVAGKNDQNIQACAAGVAVRARIIKNEMRRRTCAPNSKPTVRCRLGKAAEKGGCFIGNGASCPAAMGHGRYTARRAAHSHDNHEGVALPNRRTKSVRHAEQCPRLDTKAWDTPVTLESQPLTRSLGRGLPKDSIKAVMHGDSTLGNLVW